MPLAYLHLVKFALSCGYLVSVFDGEEWAVKKSAKQGEIVDAIKSVEESQITIRTAGGEKVGWALVSAFGLEPDETVIDHTLTSFFEDWNKAYDSVTA